MKRPILINHKREKLLNALVYFSRNTNFCGKTKLFKLLYFLDFINFRETGKSVTGLNYYAWDKGPVPADLFFEMNHPEGDLKDTIALIQGARDEDAKVCKIIAKKHFDSKHFTKRELRIMEELSFIFKEALAKDMVEVSHLPGKPWERTIKEKGQKRLIDYFLAVQDVKEKPRDYDVLFQCPPDLAKPPSRSLSLADIKERMSEIREVHEIFEDAE